MSTIEVTIGVPKLGIIKEIYNLNNKGDIEALDLNVSNGCMILNMKEVNDLIVGNEEEADMQAQPKLQLIEGGKPTNDNWLKDLEEGTVFLAIPTDQMVLDAAEWHVQLHAGDYTKLHSNLNNPMSMWVNSLRFSRQMKLAMVLGKDNG